MWTQQEYATGRRMPRKVRYYLLCSTKGVCCVWMWAGEENKVSTMGYRKWTEAFSWLSIAVKCVNNEPKTTSAFLVCRELCKIHGGGCNICGNALVELNGVGVWEGFIGNFLALASLVQLGPYFGCVGKQGFCKCPHVTELDLHGAWMNSVLFIATPAAFLWYVFYISGTRTWTKSTCKPK